MENNPLVGQIVRFKRAGCCGCAGFDHKPHQIGSTGVILRITSDNALNYNIKHHVNYYTGYRYHNRECFTLLSEMWGDVKIYNVLDMEGII